MIAAVHGHVQPNGTPFFYDLSTLEARGADGKLLTLIPKDALPPAAASLITYWETQARQSKGQQGTSSSSSMQVQFALVRKENYLFH